MNCYGLPANERDYYRLAHRHRTVLNQVPYHHSGDVDDGCAPVWDGKQLDWTAWDRRFGPYFDGSAFADLPRKGVPMECFYLPLYENWPTPMEGNYNGDYWADRAFPDGYRRTSSRSRGSSPSTSAASTGTTRFFSASSTARTISRRTAGRAARRPWLLDEPSNFQDYWALRWFGAALHEGSTQAPPGKAKLVFRCDISRPQWQRDALDGLLDYNVVGGGDAAVSADRAGPQGGERRDRGRVRRQQRDRGRQHAAGRLVARRLVAAAPTASCPGRRSARRFVEEGRHARRCSIPAATRSEGPIPRSG